MLGKRLAELRGDKTQDEIAKIFGLSRSRYAHYEQGRSEPSYELLNRKKNCNNPQIKKDTVDNFFTQFFSTNIV